MTSTFFFSYSGASAEKFMYISITSMYTHIAQPRLHYRPSSCPAGPINHANSFESLCLFVGNLVDVIHDSRANPEAYYSIYSTVVNTVYCHRIALTYGQRGWLYIMADNYCISKCWHLVTLPKMANLLEKRECIGPRPDVNL